MKEDAKAKQPTEEKEPAKKETKGTVSGFVTYCIFESGKVPCEHPKLRSVHFPTQIQVCVVCKLASMEKRFNECLKRD